MKEGFNTELLNYELFPIVVPADQVAKITIRPLHGHSRRFDQRMKLFHTGSDWLGGEGGEEVAFTLENGCLVAELRFPGEQEHTLMVKDGDQQVGDFRVYSLAEDLFPLTPWKGDFHLHSDRSDGKEEPAYVAAAGRRIGMDFLALTDHHKYEPSLEAIEKFKDVAADLRIYPGEEVHPPDNPVHIVNFGGSFGVNKLFADDKETYLKEVAELQATMPDLPAGADAHRAASSEWCFRKIDAAGGVGVFCHPFWFWNSRYYISPALSDYLLEHGSMTAVELIGGYYKWQLSNNLQTAWFFEHEASRRVPVVGASDAHGCERELLFGWYYTIVFAETAALPDLKRNIQARRSLAVEELKDETPRLYGQFRLVKYAQFLAREYFPLHDRLCREEGELMLKHLAGDAQAAMTLAGLQGAVGRLNRKLWGRG